MIVSTSSCRGADVCQPLHFYGLYMMANSGIDDGTAYLMVSVLHNTLFFVFTAFYSFYVFCFLELLSAAVKLTAHIFVLSSIAIELHTTIRTRN